MPNRITVVVSQSRSLNPKKREMEERIVTELLGRRDVEVTVVPHLYDLQPTDTGMLCLSGITGDLVVCSWLFPRATRWILDRNGIRGQEGTTLLKAAGDEEEEHKEDSQDAVHEEVTACVIDRLDLPDRFIYCLDLRAYPSPEIYVDEILRIVSEQTTQTVELNADFGISTPRVLRCSTAIPQSALLSPETERNPNSTNRRWYPVIDFSRCTNCLECIDFCLFGVYGMDRQENILVEQPDNCRLGCPACSRVCPENAIIFPQHKTPTIAGSPEVGGSMKIDLSQLFGAPDPGTPGADQAVEIAARERDEQLLLAGREAVGADAGMPKRQSNENVTQSPPDDLDRLIDAVDQFDL